MMIEKINHLIYPKLEPWQKKAAENYSKMGTGAWPDELHGLAYRITKKIGMCGEVMLQICEMYVWLRTKEFIDTQELKHYEVKKQPPVQKCKENENAKKSPSLEFDEMWGFKDKVISRWMNEV